jgi:probable HAF family extracellular repeat protein
MNRNLAMTFVISVLTFAGLGLAQEQTAPLPKKHQHHRYRLLDLGTFGGPQSYVPDGLDLTDTRILNNSGLVVGWADTSRPDPFPTFCWVDDCLVGHAFVGERNGKKDLGVLPGGASSDTTWIAENGLIAGDSENGELDPLLPGFPEIRAVLWRHGRMIDLGTLEGGYESFSTSVNSRGQVTGYSTNTIPDANSIIGTGYQTRAFVWHSGAMQDLGTLGSGTDAIAALSNDHGQVVGWSYTNSDPSAACAIYGFPLTTGSFLWDEGPGMMDIGGLGGTCTVAMGLNQRGQVVGLSWLPGDLSVHAFHWDQKNGLVDLGTLGGDFSSAIAINNHGDAVGGSYLPDNARIHATLWKGSTSFDLGAIDADTCSSAQSINEAGQIVGISGTTNCESFRPFLWESGSPMVDLNSLVSNSDIYVTFATTINDRGEIAGSGVLPNGDERAVLLVPCRDDDQACAMDATGKAAATVRPAPLTRSPQFSHQGNSIRQRFRRPLGPGLHLLGRESFQTGETPSSTSSRDGSPSSGNPLIREPIEMMDVGAQQAQFTCRARPNSCTPCSGHVKYCQIYLFPRGYICVRLQC